MLLHTDEKALDKNPRTSKRIEKAQGKTKYDLHANNTIRSEQLLKLNWILPKQTKLWLEMTMTRTRGVVKKNISHAVLCVSTRILGLG